MTQDFLIHLARESLFVALMLAGPPLLFGLVVGVVVSILQATTQIQEQTLTFVPKIIAVFLAVFLFGSWMLNAIVQFTENLIGNLPEIIR
ncbi:MAG TPA: flagellar biosynthetic protein FliQ [Peptococcaceae bacterium]|nr:MAG: Flagellar biosynthetic protein FliQ [Clostridia bacterium 41_269]HBT20157.1 flagellar biosynthetic protein FliQ [Peptococcaceae bacterium]